MHIYILVSIMQILFHKMSLLNFQFAQKYIWLELCKQYNFTVDLYLHRLIELYKDNSNPAIFVPHTVCDIQHVLFLVSIYVFA